MQYYLFIYMYIYMYVLTDINECEDTSQCSQANGETIVCVNTYGSYACVDLTPSTGECQGCMSV